MSEIFESVKEIISRGYDVAPEQIIPEAGLSADLKLDSLDRVEFVIAVEEKFQITIPDEHMEGITTVKDVVAYLEGRLKESVPGRVIKI